MNKIERFFIAAVILSGLGLRMFRLGAKQMDFDETCSIALTFNSFKELMLRHWHMYKPVFFFPYKLWINLFGTGEFIARLPAVIFGVLSIVIIYKLTKELFDERCARISAVFLTISPFNIFYSQQARQYAAFVSFTLLSYLYLVRMVKKKTSGAMMANMISNILVIFSHPFGLSIPFSQYAYLLSSSSARKAIDRKWLILQIPVFFSLVVCLALYFSRADIPGTLSWVGPLNGPAIFETLQTISSGFPRFGFDEDFIPKFNFMGLSYFLVVIFLSIVLRALLSKDKKDEKMLLLSWLLLPWSATVAFSLAFFNVYATKYLINLSPAFYILAAYGLTRMKAKIATSAILSALILSSIVSAINVYYNDHIIDWKGASAWLKGNLKVKDTIIMAPLKQIIGLVYYYRYGRNDSLRNIDYKGKYEDGRWKEVFRLDSNPVIGIDTRDVRYAGRDMLGDFTKKMGLYKDLYQGKGVFLIASRWMNDKEIVFMVDYLYRTHFISSSGYFEGVRIYRFLPFSQRHAKNEK